MLGEKVKKYSNDEITVVWKNELCSHSANCVRNLPEVFNTNERPWINVDKAPAKMIMQTIDKCPSGALSYLKDEEEIFSEVTNIRIIKNGPAIVDGNIIITLADGTEIKDKKKAAICRCGNSANKPFCDGSHSKSSFEE